MLRKKSILFFIHLTTLFANESPPLPPQSLQGEVIENRFILQTETTHKLTWESSPSPNVISYIIYRNGSLIATIAAYEPLCYQDHNRCGYRIDLYEICSVSIDQQESTSAIISLP